MRLGFLLLVGLPGCGKTTLAKNLIEHFNIENPYKFIHICYDELIHFPNGNCEFDWKSARNSVSVKIEYLIKAIKNRNVDLCPLEFKNQLQSVKFWDADFVLILDDNFYFKSMRYSLFQLAKKHKINFCQIYLNCSLESALLKNNLRGPDSIVPSDVIENMHSKIEPPNCRNNWEKYSIELSEFYNINEIFSVLNDSLNNFVNETDDIEMKELSKIQCKKSILHQSDIALRKIINCRIKKYFNDNSKEESENYIKELNLRKSELLSDIKVGNICLPNEILEEINLGDLEKVYLMKFLDSYF